MGVQTHAAVTPATISPVTLQLYPRLFGGATAHAIAPVGAMLGVWRDTGNVRDGSAAAEETGDGCAGATTVKTAGGGGTLRCIATVLLAVPIVTVIEFTAKASGHTGLLHPLTVASDHDFPVQIVKLPFASAPRKNNE